MTLSKIAKGQKVTIVSLAMSATGANRLTALGLTPGALVRVVDNSLKGTSLVECRGARLALGRGISDYIVVQ